MTPDEQTREVRHRASRTRSAFALGMFTGREEEVIAKEAAVCKISVVTFKNEMIFPGTFFSDLPV